MVSKHRFLTLQKLIALRKPHARARLQPDKFFVKSVKPSRPGYTARKDLCRIIGKLDGLRVCRITFEYSCYTATLPYRTDSRYVLRATYRAQVCACTYVTLEAANGISMKAWKIFYAIKILEKASFLFEGRCVSLETRKMETCLPREHSFARKRGCTFPRAGMILGILRHRDTYLWPFQRQLAGVSDWKVCYFSCRVKSLPIAMQALTLKVPLKQSFDPV